VGPDGHFGAGVLIENPAGVEGHHLVAVGGAANAAEGGLFGDAGILNGPFDFGRGEGLDEFRVGGFEAEADILGGEGGIENGRLVGGVDREGGSDGEFGVGGVDGDAQFGGGLAGEVAHDADGDLRGLHVEAGELDAAAAAGVESTHPLDHVEHLLRVPGPEIHALEETFGVATAGENVVG